MFNRIQLREVFAWMMLIIAIILFSFTISFAQTKKVSVDSDNGNVKIKIEKEENGKSITKDTSFTVTAGTDIDKIIEEITGDFDDAKKDDSQSNSKKHDKKVSKKKIVIDMPEITAEDEEKINMELNNAMKDMHEGLREMSNSLQKLSIRIEGDKDFDFNFEIPEIEFDDHGKHICSSEVINENMELVDSLTDKDHIVIVGDEDEMPPVLEKVVTSKNGKKAFVFKRSDSSNTEKKSSDTDDNLKIFPNPNNGKFNIRYNSDKQGDLTVKVMDQKGRVVYSEMIGDFLGEYTKEINLSGKDKGSYIVKVAQGKSAVSKKVLVN